MAAAITTASSPITVSASPMASPSLTADAGGDDDSSADAPTGNATATLAAISQNAAPAAGAPAALSQNISTPAAAPAAASSSVPIPASLAGLTALAGQSTPPAPSRGPAAASDRSSAAGSGQASANSFTSSLSSALQAQTTPAGAATSQTQTASSASGQTAQATQPAAATANPAVAPTDPNAGAQPAAAPVTPAITTGPTSAGVVLTVAAAGANHCGGSADDAGGSAQDAPGTQAGAQTTGGPTAQTNAFALPAPQATSVNAASSASSASATTAASVVSQIADQIVDAAGGKSTRFDIALDPAGLGHVNVKLEIGSSGQLTASMTFDNPHAAAEAQSRAGDLQQALEQAGFSVSQGGLSFGLGGQGANLARQDAQPQSDQSGAQTPTLAIDPADESVGSVAAFTRFSSAASGVDIRI